MPTAEGTFEAPVQRTGSRLPAAAVEGLREAFAGEVSERLPRLHAAAATLAPELLADAQRDLHTLGSGAYVVGADDVARTARAAEAVLVDDGPAETFVCLIADLEGRLRDWLR